MLEKLNKDMVRTVDHYEARNKLLNIEEAVGNRDTNYKKCRALVDILFEMTEACYKHVQDSNAQDIDPRFWNENIQLFSAKSDPFVGRTLRHPHSTKNYDQDYSEDEKYSKFLSRELWEYNNSKGQWSLSIQDETNYKVEAVQTGKPAGRGKAPAQTQSTEDVLKIDIPTTPIQNNILGDILEHLIDLNFTEKRPLPELEYPNYLPIKVCLLGKANSGKSTISRYLNNRYNMEIVSIESLVAHAINKYGYCDDSFD
jgi:hypothetical protein